MQLLDLTLPTAAENLALDEALLDATEAGELTDETLRLWEPASPLVVIGRSSRIDEEVDRNACAKLGIPTLRRSSGGAAIVAGPGCLMYAVILRYRDREHLRMLDEAHRHVLGIVRAAVIEATGNRAEQRGTSDLALAGRKFSGNSLRCKRDHFVYHGTLLYNFDLSLIERLLKIPPRQPDYREGRGHGDFVTNLASSRASLAEALASAFQASTPLAIWPADRTKRLVLDRYSKDSWNQER